MLMSLLINCAVFIGAIIFLQKKGFSQPSIDLMLAGMSGINVVNNIGNIILGLIAMSSSMILAGLVGALFSGFFFNMFIKRSGA